MHSKRQPITTRSQQREVMIFGIVFSLSRLPPGICLHVSAFSPILQRKWLKKKYHLLNKAVYHFSMRVPMTSTSLSDQLELLLHLDRHKGLSLERQLLAQLRRAILEGEVKAGRRLPSTRALAVALGISRNIVVAVYDELSIEGYIVQRHGSGTYVSDDLSPPLRTSPPAPANTPRWLPSALSPPTYFALDPEMIVFQPGVPLISPLPLSVWRSAWRKVTAKLPPAFYGRATGDPLLRGAIAPISDSLAALSAARKISLLRQVPCRL